MKPALLPVLVVIALTISACPSSGLTSAAGAANEKLEAQGLPFRWSVESTSEGEAMVMHMLPLPVGATRADEHLQQEILTAIRTKEQSKGRYSTELKEVRPMDDGREVWILKSLGAGIAYVVAVGSSPGVTNVRLKGPYNYAN